MSTDSLSCLQSLADAEGGHHEGGHHQLRDFHELAVSKNGYASRLLSICVPHMPLGFFPPPQVHVHSRIPSPVRVSWRGVRV
jgi:hypothetical protein